LIQSSIVRIESTVAEILKNLSEEKILLLRQCYILRGKK